MKTKKTKNVKRYNLPIYDIYYIKDSYYTGGLENACICENCNRPISNVAVIENDKKEALKIFNKFDANIKLKDIYSAINAPSGCPDTFSKSLNELL